MGLQKSISEGKIIKLGLTQTGVQSETKCSFAATKFRYATLWTPILAVLRKSYKYRR